MNQEETNLNIFERYVMNSIPIRLICLSDMKFVARSDVKKHFRSSVPLDDSLYHPSESVRYAILSHRWLDEGEPTYDDMKANTAEGLAGYTKLKNFCEEAREYGMEFAWSDTCCIDKNNSTELDESIRSMFRWYRNSAICIVHLAQSLTIADVEHDEWFARGWTLQELLAPERIKFFYKHWTPMTDDEDDKNMESTEVMKTLERATGIPFDDLFVNFTPGPIRVDKRMTWAARRKTTRAEDVAYSLMGIFDVSLQVAYGEGGDRAFCRLIEAIMQAGDPSVFNWKGQSAGHHTSRAIPQSPQTYMDCQTLEFDDERLEMTMTSLGLRVPLAILPLNVLRRQFHGSSTYLKLTCPLCPALEIDFTSYDPTNLFPEDVGKAACDAYSWVYALGVVNYSNIEGLSEVLGIRRKSAGFILAQKPKSNFPSGFQPTDSLGIKIAPHPETKFTKWSLANSGGLIVVEFPNIPEGSVVYIDPDYLQSVYL
ncbi:heterokaryon incompatibility protein-domain-containing protein [Suillus bovinus]|uniref:heterokaryon incompatibility protein-domain-containing protein n=1 Tax=Suillus bovinus TaxID=48563 RepID=UPI001B872C77|nr:heterokaryon incompatibility protein-domain-containing protein [Suillus bovinus]KAG2152537.1 heterokaryon incompatibility protein-domain-containing protein [Suillus bovinus]